jgi:tripartite-type tricarboxylate transporter receptor subunit TctC
MAEQVGRLQGITTIVENRPGAGTVIGTEAVSRAVPDGNTLMLTDSSFVVSPHLRKVTYDPLTAFEPICDLANVPMLYAVNSESSPQHDAVGRVRQADRPGRDDGRTIQPFLRRTFPSSWP